MEKQNEMFEVKASRKMEKDLKRRLVALGLAFVLSTGLSTPALAATSGYPDIYLNDAIIQYREGMGTSFIDENGSTLVPLRWIMESCGYIVYWNNETQTATVRNGSSSVSMTIGQKYYVFNGSVYQMDTASVIREGRTYVPLKIVASSLGADVEWNNESYIANIITDKEEVLEDRLEDLYTIIDKNNNLNYYYDKINLKDYLEKYYEFMKPTLEEHKDILSDISSLVIERTYEGYDKPLITIKSNKIVINESKTGNVSSNDALRNALIKYIAPKNNVLLNYGVTEIIAAEINNDNTNQDLDMVNVSKMLSDIIGRDKLLEAYKANDMSIIKKTLMDIYEDEALYKNLETLINNIYGYNYADTNNFTINNMDSAEMKAKHLEYSANLYGILDVYFQCKYGHEIKEDDVLEGYYQEILTHGHKKAFREEVRIFEDEKDYAVIYYTPQYGYNYYNGAYYYYDRSRPINDLGNGEVLRLK